MPRRVIVGVTDVDLAGAMAEGNIGALNACRELLSSELYTDPQAYKHGGWMTLYYLDALEIYGERLYFLWHSICHRSTITMKAVVMAWSLGGLEGVSKQVIDYAIDVDSSILDLAAIRTSVEQRLPRFNSTDTPLKSTVFSLN